MEQENKLEVVIKESGLDTSQADNLMKSFAGFYSQAREIVEKCKNISVTDVSQKDEMAKARESRLNLQHIRTDADKTRVKLKEQSLREGRAIQGVYNVLEALIKPVEENLEKQEKFAENLEKERLEKQFEERVEKLSKYVNDVSLYSLKDMADEVFENLLAGCKANFEKAQQEQKDAEEKQKEEQARQQKWHNRQIELAQLWDYIQEEVTANTSDEEYNKIIQQAKKDKKDYEDDQEKIRLQNIELQKQIDKDRKAKEEAENKLREEREAQLKKEADEKASADAKLKSDEEAKIKALLAPDIDKLLDFAKRIRTIEVPAVKSNSANTILAESLKLLIQVAETIEGKTSTL